MNDRHRDIPVAGERGRESQEDYNLRAVRRAYQDGHLSVDELEDAVEAILDGKCPDLPCCTPF